MSEARTSTDLAIRTRGVRRRFGPQVVLDGFDLEVERGTTFVIMGLSGSGKSVSLKILTGLLRADAGEIQVAGARVDGASRSEMSRIRSHLGFVFQSAALIAWLTAGENVALPLREQGIAEREVWEIVHAKLRSVGLTDVAHKYPSQLSGGMRKRVGFARAVVLDPQILLYDEPTTGLDPRTTRTIDDLIVRARDEMGATGVVVSHDVDSTLRIADRIGVLNNGRLELVATPSEFIESDHPLVRDFLAGRGGGAGRNHA